MSQVPWLAATMIPEITDPQLICGYAPADFSQDPPRVESDGSHPEPANGRAAATVAAEAPSAFHATKSQAVAVLAPGPKPSRANA